MSTATAKFFTLSLVNCQLVFVVDCCYVFCKFTVCVINLCRPKGRQNDNNVHEINMAQSTTNTSSRRHARDNDAVSVTSRVTDVTEWEANEVFIIVLYKW